MTIRKRGLFRRTWRAWLTAPSWKKARIPTEIAIVWNLLVLGYSIFIINNYLSALYICCLIVFLIFFNWLCYIKHIEFILSKLLEIQMQRDEEVSKVD